MPRSHAAYEHRQVVEVLLDKINRMREELLTLERALAQMEKQAVEPERRDGSGKSRLEA